MRSIQTTAPKKQTNIQLTIVAISKQQKLCARKEEEQSRKVRHQIQMLQADLQLSGGLRRSEH